MPAAMQRRGQHEGREDVAAAALAADETREGEGAHARREHEVAHAGRRLDFLDAADAGGGGLPALIVAASTAALTPK